MENMVARMQLEKLNQEISYERLKNPRTHAKEVARLNDEKIINDIILQCRLKRRVYE